MTTLTNLANVHGPAHDPVEDIRNYCHYVARLRSPQVRTTARGRYNRVQYVTLRLLERVGRLTPEYARILARIRAIV